MAAPEFNFWECPRLFTVTQPHLAAELRALNFRSQKFGFRLDDDGVVLLDGKERRLNLGQALLLCLAAVATVLYPELDLRQYETWCLIFHWQFGGRESWNNSLRHVFERPVKALSGPRSGHYASMHQARELPSFEEGFAALAAWHQVVLPEHPAAPP